MSILELTIRSIRSSSALAEGLLTCVVSLIAWLVLLMVSTLTTAFERKDEDQRNEAAKNFSPNRKAFFLHIHDTTRSTY